MIRSFRSPFQISLLINLVVTLGLAVIAGLAATAAIDGAVDRTLREEIRRDIALLTERTEDRDVLPPVASLTASLGQRLFDDGGKDAQSVYLLVRSDQSVVAGNAVTWPPDVPLEERWIETDATGLGHGAGSMLARVEAVDDGFFLLVGRRLTARQALIRNYVPILVGAVLCLGVVSTFLFALLHRRYQRRVRAFNRVFDRVRTGDIAARIESGFLTPEGDELSTLGANVNEALAEVARLMRGLDSYSQVAAHELNHAVSIMRERFLAAGDTGAAQDAEQLLELVSHILELAKIEATPGYAMQPVSLAETAASVATLYADTFEDRDIRFELQLPPDDRMEVIASAPLLASAITNLLSNAAKFAPEGSAVSLVLAATDRHFSVIVQDEGPGVATTSIAELAGAGRKAGPGSHGFGLRHVQAVAIRHGARLTLANTNPGLKVSIAFVRPS